MPGFVEHQAAMQAFQNSSVGSMTGAGALVTEASSFSAYFAGNISIWKYGSAIFAGLGFSFEFFIRLVNGKRDDKQSPVKQAGDIVNGLINFTLGNLGCPGPAVLKINGEFSQFARGQPDHENGFHEK